MIMAIRMTLVLIVAVTIRHQWQFKKANNDKRAREIISIHFELVCLAQTNKRGNFSRLLIIHEQTRSTKCGCSTRKSSSRSTSIGTNWRRHLRQIADSRFGDKLFQILNLDRRYDCIVFLIFRWILIDILNGWQVTKLTNLTNSFWRRLW